MTGGVVGSPAASSMAAYRKIPRRHRPAGPGREQPDRRQSQFDLEETCNIAVSGAVVTPAYYARLNAATVTAITIGKIPQESTAMPARGTRDAEGSDGASG